MNTVFIMLFINIPGILFAERIWVWTSNKMLNTNNIYAYITLVSMSMVMADTMYVQITVMLQPCMVSCK